MLAAGPLQPLENLLAALLVWLHQSVGVSWAWSIVVLTVIVRMLLVPLAVRQIHAMQRLQRVAPEVRTIQRRHQDDRARMNEELMRFYREHEINPAASCLPLLLQIPVFISLYLVLRHFETEILPRLHEPLASLGWLGIVPDITAPAASSWSGYLLLGVYAASQTASTLLTPASTDRGQRALLLVLPLAFMFVVARFPAGLVLYWVTTNLWTTGQGLVTRRLRQQAAPAPRPAPPKPPQRVRKVRRKKRKER